MIFKTLFYFHYSCKFELLFLLIKPKMFEVFSIVKLLSAGFSICVFLSCQEHKGLAECI